MYVCVVCYEHRNCVGLRVRSVINAEILLCCVTLCLCVSYEHRNCVGLMCEVCYIHRNFVVLCCICVCVCGGGRSVIQFFTFT